MFSITSCIHPLAATRHSSIGKQTAYLKKAKKVLDHLTKKTLGITKPLALICCSVNKLCPTLCDPMDCSTPGFPVFHHLMEFAQTHITSIELMMPSNHLILCHPLLLLPSVFPSIRVFSNKSASGGQSTGASTSALSSNECSGLISFRIYWFDLLASQRTIKSLLQHHNSKASVLWGSDSLMVQLSHPYMTTGKIICVSVRLTQSCSTLCDPMDCSPPDSSVHGILQARILEWLAIYFSRGSS